MKRFIKLISTFLTTAIAASIIFTNSVFVSANMVNIPMSSLNGLTPVEQATFDYLRTQICNTASGANLSTTYEVPLSALGLSSYSWTAEELNVPYLASNGQINPDAQAAVLSRIAGDINLIAAALVEDCPFEMYWYDKTGISINCPILCHYDPSRGNYVISADGNVVYRFGVSRDYAGATRYQLNPNAVARAQAAASNARAIVARYAGLSDYEKLTHYRDEICALASYDNAAPNSSYYGDPYQLVNVFDGNPATNVVCEGYSKAFKYLCDLTTFSNTSIRCYTVGGSVTYAYESGLHMFNIVRMDDGKNYIVDLTNYDTGVPGCTDSFLSGCTSAFPGGITYIAIRDNATFNFDSRFMRLYNSNVFSISSSAYVPVPGGYGVVIPSDPSGAQSFIERLYSVALGRASDPTGAQYWLNKVMSGASSGADLARGFLFSQEFLGKNSSDEEFVTVLYNTFFDRAPDGPGMQYWLNNLSSGMSRQDVINGFINSVEWYQLCRSYGIRSGSAAEQA